MCLHLEKVNELLAELYDGVCGSHVGGRSLAHQAMTEGFGGHKCKRMLSNMYVSVSGAKNTLIRQWVAV